ncbi:MAG: T9SS type A sorting domain-containing protein, partial [Ferruginibacter sp.]
GSGYISASGYLNIPGSQVADLTASPKYPNSPDIVATLNSMEYSNVGDNYGGRLLGYICAPATGFYTFYIAGDDQAGVFLSTDENPANKVLIAYNESFVPFRGYYANATQKSAPIKLIKGVRYYIETLHKEKTATDHLSVAWELPNGSFEAPIPGNRLSPFGSYFPGRTAPNFVIAMQNEANKGALKLRATPNPSSNYFTVNISSKNNQLVNVIVTDAAGRIVERKQNITANSTIQIGNRLPAGLYFVEVLQGAEKQRLKLVKQ